MNKPTILVFCPVLGAFGGTETHVLGISSALAQNGWKVQLSVVRSALSQQLVDRVCASGVRFSTWPSPAFFKSLFQRHGLLYTNSQGNASPIMWRLKGPRQRGFHHVHTSADRVEQSYWRAGFVSFVRSAPRLVACSQTTRQNLIELGARGCVTFLPYLTSVKSQDDLHLSPLERRTDLRFSFIGRVAKSKGIDLIMEAAGDPRCAGIEWHIYGDGDYLPVLREANVPGIVLHGGFSDANELERIHRETDALILPSFHSEGMPLALLEGMAKGLPWIATNKGGTAELAGGHEDLVVFEPGDMPGFVSACAKLRQRIVAGLVDRESIKRVFDENFANEIVTARWMDYCEACLDGQSAMS